MAYEVPTHFAESFTTNTELLLQQRVAMMMRNAIVKSFTGSKSGQVVKQFGEVEFQEKTTRHGDTVFSDINHKQRWVFPTDYDLALPVDDEDELKMLNSPVSSYVMAMQAAWNRKKNVTIRDALLGDAKTGTNGGTTTAFDTSNQQIASGSVGLTISKLRQTKEILDLAENDSEGDVEYNFAYTAKQVTDLLESTEVTSSDYNTVQALVAGKIDTFLGFKFIKNNKLGVDGSSDRRCIAWNPTGLCFGTWGGFKTRIDERADKNYTTQVWMAGTIGATRTQESKVVEILCSE